ncbi:hypothetical protein BGZ70_006613 [Mortierella alpina]|uniref:Survival motor neuron Tudor domain-containing protein n=1 Tax=Mortierella alpina TaxID=64518 RepID=A0A9P6J803_MORAP|nr:hypothetical protein BGZ70_006613 [Mortierella alpina]
MTEEQSALHHEENWEYGEEEEEDAEDYDEGDEEYDGQDDSIEVGDEIALVYHSKAIPENKASKYDSDGRSTTTSGKSKATESDASCSPAKRTKLSNGQGAASSNPDCDATVAKGTELGSTPDSTGKGASIARAQSAQKTSEFSITERKPSFKKADKVGLDHHKAQWQDSSKQKKAASSRQTLATAKPTVGVPPAKPPAAATAAATAAAPPIDAATIAYYQGLGYYYDPLYGSSGQAGGAAADEQEQPDCATPAPKTRAKNRQSAPSSSTAQPGPYDFGAVPSTSAHHPYHPHGFYAGHPSHIPAGATAASATGGGYTMPGASGMAHPWMAFGAGGGPKPAPYGQGFAVPGAAPRYPAGMGMGMMPPPSLSQPLPPPFQQAGPFSASGMDDEALSNLIMAWYFSGYYTGLYQGQRR